MFRQLRLFQKFHLAASVADAGGDFCQGRTLFHPRGATPVEQGRRAGFAQLLFNPPAAFVKKFIFEQGFRDGTYGLVISPAARLLHVSEIRQTLGAWPETPMKPAVSVSLVISTFKQPRVLAKSAGQSAVANAPAGGILISDDGSDEPTRELVKKISERSSVPVKHIWHPHDGFRKTVILNKTVLAAGGNYLIFTDGDCVPHPKFVADHAAWPRRAAGAGPALFCREEFVTEFEPGRTPVWRWMLTGKITGVVKGFRWPVPVIRHDTKQRGIIGCNMAFWREDILAVNGFDEDYTGWARARIPTSAPGFIIWAAGANWSMAAPSRFI